MPTQSTILAANTTAATSTDVPVEAGGSVTLGIFAATEAVLPEGVHFLVKQDTPGVDNIETTLNNQKRSCVVVGPGTFRVSRPAYSGSAFGVFKEI